MAEPDNLVLTLLREMRHDMNARFDQMNTRFEQVDSKFDGLEAKIESIRQAAFGESVLGRYAAADVEHRLDAIEKRLNVIEKRG